MKNHSPKTKARPLHNAVVTLAVLGFIIAGVMAVLVLGTLSWTIRRTLPNAWSVPAAIVLFVVFVVAVVALYRCLPAHLRWWTLAIVGAFVAVSPLFMHTILGSWDASVNLSNTQRGSRQVSWTTLHIVAVMAVVSGAALAMTGALGHVRARAARQRLSVHATLSR